MNIRILLLILLGVFADSVSATTKVVLLGTGTPNPEPDRSGPV